MTPIPQTELDRILRGIAPALRLESNLENYVNVDYAIREVTEGYEMQAISAFADNLADPKSCLILRESRSWLCPERFCSIMLFWVAPAHRTDPSLVIDMHKTVDAFAKLNECTSTLGSAWVFQGARDTSPVWAAHGYDLQQKVHIKTYD